MPAFMHHNPRHDVQAAMTACPSCLSRVMQIREVRPHWEQAKLDFIYECPACCTEVRETVAPH